MGYWSFKDDVSLELNKVEIAKVSEFADLVKSRYGWEGFVAIDLCYGYKTMYSHMDLPERQSLAARDAYKRKTFPGWDSELMTEAIEKYMQLQFDIELDSYLANEEKIMQTNKEIRACDVSAKKKKEFEYNADSGELGEDIDVEDKLKSLYDLMKKQFEIRKMLRESLLGKNQDKGSKVRGDKTITFLERINNEVRQRNRNERKPNDDAAAA